MVVLDLAVLLVADGVGDTLRSRLNLPGGCVSAALIEPG